LTCPINTFEKKITYDNLQSEISTGNVAKVSTFDGKIFVEKKITYFKNE
jgi:hypothetical protein